jgi:hypothetical protein
MTWGPKSSRYCGNLWTCIIRKSKVAIEIHEISHLLWSLWSFSQGKPPFIRHFPVHHWEYARQICAWLILMPCDMASVLAIRGGQSLFCKTWCKLKCCCSSRSNSWGKPMFCWVGYTSCIRILMIPYAINLCEGPPQSWLKRRNVVNPRIHRPIN